MAAAMSAEMRGGGVCCEAVRILVEAAEVTFERDALHVEVLYRLQERVWLPQDPAWRADGCHRG